ncbi:hypothetical protein D3872_05975 [Massilia cavernae]|uniref:Uncharacterized protein n=1 Tax=Massilia cavernae TaxID=2320864 RepID=A0A418Y5G6_9BURK|nr:hypothetical protein D3872_05975 [Massilia cavernae]
MISGLVTLLAVFVTFKLLPSEKEIERQLQRQYSTGDPQFRRSMGVLLGPPPRAGVKVHENRPWTEKLHGEFAAIFGSQL